MTFGQGQEITLTLNTRLLSFTELVYIYHISGHWLK